MQLPMPREHSRPRAGIAALPRDECEPCVQAKGAQTSGCAKEPTENLGLKAPEPRQWGEQGTGNAGMCIGCQLTYGISVHGIILGACLVRCLVAGLVHWVPPELGP